MGAAQPGTAHASFELARVELADGRLLVSGWWFGVRGMRFVRPALLVDGRKTLATLEHKPWAVAADGSWTAAFPWKDEGPPELGGVTLAVAPSVEVPLDAESAASTPLPAPVPAAAPEPLNAPAGLGDESLRDELRALERRLDEMREELHETRAVAAEREGRCREFERTAAERRRDADATHEDRDELLRARANAERDRDRALAQHAEAVGDREAAIRTRTRMEDQADEAERRAEAAEARREATIADRDEMRRQRDEVLVAHRALQEQLKGEWASAERAHPQATATDRRASVKAATAAADAGSVTQPVASRARAEARTGARGERPSGVRVIPAARTVAAHLHRAQRERGSGVTQFDMWVMRILGSVAALAFIALLVMILKAFFVF